MFNFEGNSSSQIQLVDIKLMATNKIRLGTPLLEKFEANSDTHKVFIDRNIADGKFYLTLVPKSDEDNKDGKNFNAKGDFSHKTLSHKLGGQYSEWSANWDEPIADEASGLTYYALTLVVNGAEKRAELDRAATEVVTETNDDKNEEIVDVDHVENAVEESTTVQN